MDAIKDKCELAEKFLKSLASRHRLLILCELAQGEKSVSALIEATKIAQTSMSQHLNKLKDEKIVDYRRDHRTLYYRIINPDVHAIMDILYNKFCKNADEGKQE